MWAYPREQLWANGLDLQIEANSSCRSYRSARRLVVDKTDVSNVACCRVLSRFFRKQQQCQQVSTDWCNPAKLGVGHSFKADMLHCSYLFPPQGAGLLSGELATAMDGMDRPLRHFL